MTHMINSVIEKEIILMLAMYYYLSIMVYFNKYVVMYMIVPIMIQYEKQKVLIR